MRRLIASTMIVTATKRTTRKPGCRGGVCALRT
jgi:hypothetical protein